MKLELNRETVSPAHDPELQFRELRLRCWMPWPNTLPWRLVLVLLLPVYVVFVLILAVMQMVLDFGLSMAGWFRLVAGA